MPENSARTRQGLECQREGQDGCKTARKNEFAMSYWHSSPCSPTRPWTVCRWGVLCGARSSTRGG